MCLFVWGLNAYKQKVPGETCFFCITSNNDIGYLRLNFDATKRQKYIACISYKIEILNLVMLA